MRLVHKAPLQTIDPVRRRTTAALPTAELPPTTALARVVGNATIVALSATVKATRVIRRKVVNPTRTTPDYDACVMRR